MKIEGSKIILEKGDKFSIEVESTAADAVQQPQVAPAPEAIKPGQPISFNLKIYNDRPQPVVIDNKINFVVSNPDKNGLYYGDNGGKAYTGSYNRVAYIVGGDYKEKSITIPALGSVDLKIEYSAVTGSIWKNDGITIFGLNVVTGLGGRTPVPESYVKGPLWPSSRGKSNVLLYVSGDSNVVVPTCLSSNKEFLDGEAYVVRIS